MASDEQSVAMEAKEQAAAKKSFIEVFMDGAKRGWDVGLRMMTTSLIFAAVLVYILQLTGVMDVFERVFSPVMGIFGLPGVAVVALIAGFFSKPGGAATAALLYSQGSINEVHATILFPAIILMGRRCTHCTDRNEHRHEDDGTTVS